MEKPLFAKTKELSLACRKAYLPWMLGWIGVFCWLYVCVLPQLACAAFPRGFFGDGLRLPWLWLWLPVCPLTAVLLRPEQFVAGARYVAPLALCFAGGSFLLPQYTPVWAGLLSAAMGYLFTAMGYGFFMLLNNPEKLLSMVLAVALPKLTALFLGAVAPKGFPLYFTVGCLLLLLPCAFCFPREEVSLAESAAPLPKKSYSLLPVVFLAMALNDLAAPAVVHGLAGLAGVGLLPWYVAGVIAGLVLLLLLRQKLGMFVEPLLNLSFGLLGAGFVLSLAAAQLVGLAAWASLCFGLAYAFGLTNIYYLAGVMSKRFASLRFYRLGIVLCAGYYGAGFTMLRFCYPYWLIIAVCSACLLLSFFVALPYFMRSLYAGDWIDDTQRTDVTRFSRLEAFLRQKKLAPQEIAVTRLLLRGYTIRQTAASLSLAHSTVNSYATAVYRKLEINSRGELLLLLKDYLEDA